MTTTLLTTKLYIPPVRPGLISRPHLIERLNAGLARRLILVSAPPGFGKTTLLSAWIADCGLRIADSSSREPKSAVRNLQFCWLSLDQDDNDPVRFLVYLAAALESVAPALGETVQALLRAPPPDG